MRYTGTFTLQINDEVLIRTGWVKKDKLIYAGMPNAQTYSMVISRSYAHNSWAYNLYLPIDQRDFRHADLSIRVDRIDSNSVTVTVSYY
ncbi:MAG: hypothetical protein R3F48_09460 [Candidatus Zixiibacteriota bacterium]